MTSFGHDSWNSRSCVAKETIYFEERTSKDVSFDYRYRIVDYGHEEDRF
jgi:hypothetical protein